MAYALSAKRNSIKWKTKHIPHCRKVKKNPIEKWKKDWTSIPLKHIYMTPGFQGLATKLTEMQYQDKILPKLLSLIVNKSMENIEIRNSLG